MLLLSKRGSKVTVIIVEDEQRIAAFIEKGLKSNGHTTTVADNAFDALDWAIGQSFDLIILDLGLPGKDGLEVVQDLHGQGVNTPILILTARDDIKDKVAGLDYGADDYMTKPFRFEELLARVRARLRTPAPTLNQEPTTLTAHEITLDLKRRKAKVNGAWLDLSTREFLLAETLFLHPEQIFSRQQLLDRVWGYDYDPGSNIVDVYIGYLRKKFGSHVIETVRGMGYRLA